MSEVVIGGISGRFPESRDVSELWENLTCKVDMVTEDGRRWKPGSWDLPKRNGKLVELDKFDSSFFEVSPKQAENMDPMLRILLEVTYEAILNAGVNPSKLSGTRTGVWIGVSGSETVEALTSDPQNMEGYVITGCSMSMFANRISFFYDFKGPSMAIDTACSSSLMALHLARQSINNGDCDAAIVGGAQLVLKPQTSLQFKKLNMLSQDGACKAFDESADGYVRSEAVAAVYLCKREDARRVYCDVIHSKSSSDGKKVDGITFPSGEQQKRLLHETYKECGINPCDVFYVEAHGTGTKAGDRQEVDALDHVMCEGRVVPLLIGSIKSNMGHSEPASGICGVIKCCLAAFNRQIPPNLHIKKLNPKIQALVEGRIKPVGELTSLPEGDFIMGVNSFGFGGTNVHVVLRANHRPAISSHDDGPTICLMTSRTEEGIQRKIKEPPDGAASFLNVISDVSTQRHPYRGYYISMGSDDVMVDEQCSCKVVKQRKVWFVCSGMGSQWVGMGKDLLHIPIFATSIEKCTKALQCDIDVTRMLTSADDETYNDITNAFVGLVAVQIGLIDVLSSLKVGCDGIVGHSVGELACAYADGCLTLEQTIQAAYARGKCVKQAKLPRGKMAAVGLTWEECEEQCPPNVAPACHNAKDSVTITGTEDDVTAFVASLKEKEIFAKLVETSGIAFHSVHMEHVYPLFLKELKKIIPEPKQRSDKWRSTSSPSSHEFAPSHDVSRESSAEYHANNLRNPVKFYDEIIDIESDAIVIEIAPHCLMQPIIKRSLPDIEYVGLCNKRNENGVKTLLSAAGQLHCLGVDVQANNLLGHASLPTQSRDLLGGHVDWDHEQTWFVPSPYQFLSSSSGGKLTDTSFKFDTSSNSEDRYLFHHVIDGRPLLPATALLQLARQTFSNFLETSVDDLAVQFDDVTICEPTFLNDNNLQLHVQFNPQKEEFTITNESRLVAWGKIKQLDGSIESPQKPDHNSNLKLRRRDVYRKLCLSGYQYGETFRLIQYACEDGSFGRIEWKDNYITFMDAVLQFTLIKSRDNKLRLPTRVRRIKFRPFPPNQAVPLSVDVSSDANRTLAGGHMEVIDLHVVQIPKRNRSRHPHVKAKKFVPNFHDIKDNDITKYTDVIRSQANKIFKNISEPKYVSDDIREFWESHTSSILLRFLNGVTNNDWKTLKKHESNLLADWSVSYCLLSDEIMTSTMGIAVSELLFDVTVGEIPKQQLDYTLSVMAEVGNYLRSIPNCNHRCETFSSYSKKIKFQDSVQADGECNILIANDIFTSGIEDGRASIQNILELLSNQTSFVLLHHTCGGNVIQDVYDEIMRKLNPDYMRKAVSVQQVTSEFENHNFRLVSHKQQTDSGSHLLLFKRSSNCDVTNKTIVEATMKNFDWIGEVKNALTNANDDVWLIARENVNGFEEMAASLRRETKSDRIKCVSNCSLDAACHLPGNLNGVLECPLVSNVYVDGEWGSLHHVTSNKPPPVSSDRSYFDLHSHAWVDLPPLNKPEIKTSFTALNFRDVMLASGKLPSEAIPGDTEKYRTLLGLEFSGYDHVGRKTMGIVPGDGFSTHVIHDADFTWIVPDDWSLADAATVPVVYSTAYYSLLVRGRLKEGESILIHCGAGGVGQAAISIALSRRCKVYTTVSSEEKKNFLKMRFPQLQDENFAQSRDATFERDILNKTNGKGVDLVLNSLSGELLHAGVRCLAKHGRFLEIGKNDLVQNNKLGMALFLKNISFHGILLDSLFGDVTEQWMEVRELVQEGIEKGDVKPLPHRIFKKSEVESAFRFMAQGVHIGKVLVDVTSDEDCVTGRVSFDANLCYVITGGLGGFGLELCDWLVKRGAKKLIVTSKSGIKTAYQEYCVTKWRSQGISATISNSDVASDVEAMDLLDERTGGIFHLAMTLKDAVFENQTKESFEAVCQPKWGGLTNLDRWSRSRCPNLRYFVAFSSIASYNGTTGQSNYILANSTMEQICRIRHNDRLPAVALQWGAVGDVGIAAERYGDAPVAGTLPQPIESCLEYLDELLLRGEPVVACYITKDKTSKRFDVETISPASKVSEILGIQDLSKVSIDASLLSLGADSLMTSQIIQYLSRDCGINKNEKEVRCLTFGELMRMKVKEEKQAPEARKYQRLRSSARSVTSIPQK